MKKARFLLMTISVIALTFLSSFAFGQAAVSTDQLDYPPGSTVIITGTGFQAGEIVTLQVLHTLANGDNDTSPAHQPWTVTADSLGNISSTWLVPLDEDELGATLLLTADGQSSGLHAETTFTDAGGSLAIGNNSISASNVCSGSTNVLLHGFTLTGSGNPDAITAVSFVTTGNYSVSEIVNFKLYKTTTATFSTANLLNTISSPAAAGTQTFSLNALNGN